ncbi:MAG: hypothetical protein MUF81_14860 [Verrucomicrobia bacterium]|jgi:hypothetical protein|nr:hypothetical protein [Verrucomicrobiota bacterium]
MTNQPPYYHAAADQRINNQQKVLNMKKLSLVSALVLGGLVACSITANAQECPGGKKGDKGSGHWTVEQRLEKMVLRYFRWSLNIGVIGVFRPRSRAW